MCLPLAEPSFVFADVIREHPDGVDSGDDRVYFFFTEVSVEYEFVFKLMIPRVARVCKVSTLPEVPLVLTHGAHVSGGLVGSGLPLKCRHPSASPSHTMMISLPGQPGGVPVNPGSIGTPMCERPPSLSKPASDPPPPGLPSYRNLVAGHRVS